MTELATEHYASLHAFLGELAAEKRQVSNEKLPRLTSQQFMDLSTDINDELSRRLSEDEPFLQVNVQYHPKRNQARQKLATLPMARFKELARDVFVELERRFPSVLNSIKTKHQSDDLYADDHRHVPQIATANSTANPKIAKPLTANAIATQPLPLPNNKVVKSAPVNNQSNRPNLDLLMADLGDIMDDSGLSSQAEASFKAQIAQLQKQLTAERDQYDKMTEKYEDLLATEKNVTPHSNSLFLYLSLLLTFIH